jgi:hypothetical protein
MPHAVWVRALGREGRCGHLRSCTVFREDVAHAEPREARPAMIAEQWIARGRRQPAGAAARREGLLSPIGDRRRCCPHCGAPADPRSSSAAGLTARGAAHTSADVSRSSALARSRSSSPASGATSGRWSHSREDGGVPVGQAGAGCTDRIRRVDRREPLAAREVHHLTGRQEGDEREARMTVVRLRSEARLWRPLISTHAKAGRIENEKSRSAGESARWGSADSTALISPMLAFRAEPDLNAAFLTRIGYLAALSSVRLIASMYALASEDASSFVILSRAYVRTFK